MMYWLHATQRKSTWPTWRKCYAAWLPQECVWKEINVFFIKSQVHYLGHTVSSKGVQPTQEKVRAIRDAPAPTNIHQLKSFLGLINFYAKFLPNLSEKSLLDVGPIATESVSARQRPSPLLITARSFQPPAAVAARCRCLTLRTWSSIVSHDGRRIREADRLCLKIPDNNRAPLFTTG